MFQLTEVYQPALDLTESGRQRTAKADPPWSVATSSSSVPYEAKAVIQLQAQAPPADAPPSGKRSLPLPEDPRGTRLRGSMPQGETGGQALCRSVPVNEINLFNEIEFLKSFREFYEFR